MTTEDYLLGALSVPAAGFALETACVVTARSQPLAGPLTAPRRSSSVAVPELCSVTLFEDTMNPEAP